jgi:aryl-alcohol dehydrogenase-like predicted oxidoreductase
MVIATKCGIHYAGSEMVTDNRPEQLRRECDESLRRLGTDHVELLYLHAPDDKIPIEDSAGALRELMEAGKTRSVGVSNFTVEQMEAFHAVCPITAVQMPYNMLQRDIEQRTIPWCRARNIAVMIYWPLMKGLLTGKLQRGTKLDAKDNRLKYPMYQGDELERNLEFLETLRKAAALPVVRRGAPDSVGRGSPNPAPITVAQLVVNWTISQPGITSALCGAKRPDQIAETAGAMSWSLTGEQLAIIDAALTARGKAAAKRVFT